MQTIFIIAWHEYVTNIRRPAFIFFTLLIPALGLVTLIISGFFSGQAANFFRNQFTPETKPIGVVDHSRQFTPIAPDYEKRFKAYADEEAAKSALIADELVALVVIPNDYLASGKMTAYIKSGFSGIVAADSNTLRNFIVSGLLKGKVDDATLKRATSVGDINTITLDTKGQPTSSGGLSMLSGFLAPYFLSIFLVVSIFASSGYLLRSVSEEKETRVIEIVLSSVSAMELLIGKVIGLGALGLTQVGVWLVSGFLLNTGMGALVTGAVLFANPSSFLISAIYFLLGYLLFATLMAAAGALGANLRESQQLAGIFSFVAFVPYMLAGLLFANPNQTLARVLSFFPLTAPTMMRLRLPLGEIPTIDIILSIVILIVSIPFAWWLGAKLFRMGLLMYGKRPSLRELARALRGA
jgi:ABC-2 type transport system permease protein